MASVRSRWTARLKARLQLLTAARKRHVAHPTAATAETLSLRKRQVAFARRVLARHSPLRTRVSARGVTFIAAFEGCSLKPYADPVGVWTIGYGHTEGVCRTTPPLKNVAAARRLLQRDLDRKYAPAVRELRLPLRSGQFDALVSLVYNCGPGVVAPNTTIGAALRRRDWKAAADAFLLYDHAGGKVLPGLTRRREAERRMFLGA